MPRKEHAVVMCKFATDCLTTMKDLVKQLETSLGPDTAELNMRVGLHSGPVTAGVLRGDKGRFQLFGDTMVCSGCHCRQSFSLANADHCNFRIQPPG